jgi:hypothetical protein
MLIRTSFLSQLVCVGLFVANIRIGVFWHIFTRHATGQQSLDEVLLILLLYPEGMLIPRNWSWTLTRGIGFSGALFVGSMFITAIIAAMLRVASGLWRSKSKES